ncbi:hypothetical protein NMG60_11032163 [Bertholletia excelsa]
MALEAIVLQQDLFGFNTKDQREKQYYGHSFNFPDNQTETIFHPPDPSLRTPSMEQWIMPNSFMSSGPPQEFSPFQASTNMLNRPKRRRPKSKRNKEDIENQRLTHITVERNRRKQMNEYLSVLRGLMPDSYVQKGDQASIIGGAINYVKELEQRVQYLGGKKHLKQKFQTSSPSSSSSPLPFSEVFSFPQFSTGSDNSMLVSNSSQIADIEVRMVESHADLKIRSKRRPKQLLKMVSGFQFLRLTILHLNVTTAGQVVLYSVSVKVEDECNLTSLDEIASAVNQLFVRIHEEAVGV